MHSVLPSLISLGTHCWASFARVGVKLKLEIRTSKLEKVIQIVIELFWSLYSLWSCPCYFCVLGSFVIVCWLLKGLCWEFALVFNLCFVFCNSIEGWLRNFLLFFWCALNVNKVPCFVIQLMDGCKFLVGKWFVAHVGPRNSNASMIISQTHLTSIPQK